MVDVSLLLVNGMRGVGFEPATTISNEGYNTTNLRLYSHAATHMDAPLHFIDGGATIDQIELERCIGEALIIDLSHVAPNALITPEDLGSHGAEIGQGTRLLLRTDWSMHVHLPDYRSHMPRVSARLATWLVEKKIGLLGLETPSVASLRPENKAELTEVHQILLRGGVVIVEGLTNLRDVRQSRVEFIVLPLRIDGCDGSPVRAIVVEE
ncbi:MAG: cyclase family protein [Caldilineaceae bacterium]|nr:cyclase family protein [Caldilineaceae bacterium]